MKINMKRTIATIHITVSWNAVLFLLNNKFPAYLSFRRKETDFEPDSS